MMPGSRALARILAALAIVAAPPVRAAQPQDLRFTESCSLPALGLHLRVMAGAREKPLPTPHAYAYRITTAVRTYNAELFDPHELWVADQHAAEWADDQNNRLVIAAIRYPPIPPFEQPHVSREAYLRARAPGADTTGWTDQTLATWMDAFVGSQGALARAVPPPFSRLSNLEEFVFPGGPSNIVAYALRLNPAALGQARAPSDWIAAIIHVGPGQGRDQVRKRMQSRFLYYITAAAADGDEGVPEPSARFQLKGAGPDAAQPAALRASKERVAASIANLPGWWYTETENFILVSDVSPTEQTTIRRLQAEIEVLRGTFEGLIPPRVPVETVSVVRMPATEEAYVDYVGQAYAWTGGIWMPTRKELVLRPLVRQGARTRREHMLRAAYHESLHQYLYYAFDRVDAAPWYNEGHAVMFETAVFRDRGVQLGEHPDITPYLENLLRERSLSIPEILKLDLDGFYSDQNETRARHYALAWGLVYYLRLGLATETRSPYAGIPDRYADALWSTRDGEAATAATFENVDMEDMGRDFRAFWLSSRRRAAAERIWLPAPKSQ